MHSTIFLENLKKNIINKWLEISSIIKYSEIIINLELKVYQDALIYYYKAVFEIFF